MQQRWFAAGIALLTSWALLATPLNAHIAGTAKTQKDGQEEVQRTPSGAFDLQQNVVSNVAFYTTNYGIFGYNIARQTGGTFWPRGSQNQYLFAGGAWFAALKPVGSSAELRKRVMITYNPNSGQSWMVPGSIEDGLLVDQTSAATQKNRTFFSTDFSTADGTDFFNPSFPNWPVWDSSPNDTLRIDNYYGYYINDITQRNRTNFDKGPAFISDEDVFAVYKDTDLSRYEGGAQRRADEGFPLGFQIEQMIYSWGFGDYRDMLFIKYLFIHPERINNAPTDTLFACWMAAVMDVDIAPFTNPRGGAANDRARYYTEEDSLNLAVQWTNGDRGEAGQGFGYLGFNFLESPAVNADGYLRTDRKQFPVSEQLGLRTMRNWPITVDPIENEDRYNFMSSGQRDGDEGPGDRRLLMATGPFNMRPGDSARIVVGLILGTTATGKDADGTTEDLAELIRKVKFAQFVYDNQFRAPRAPDLPIVKGYATNGGFYQVPESGWLPLNNAVVIQWDSTAEQSIDTLEGGMDFLGYRIYRARRADLDTFNTDEIESQRVGPLGWKQIGIIGTPPPFLKSATTVPDIGLPLDELDIADIIQPGQRRFLVARRPSASGPWGTYFNELASRRPDNYQYQIGTDGRLNVSRFDKYDSVRTMYVTTQFDDLPTVARDQSNNTGWFLNATQAAAAKDSLIKLILAKKVKAEPFRFADVEKVGDRTRVVRRPWEETSEVRNDVVGAYLRRLSTNRTFFDDGDDDNNGVVRYSADPRRSEKLINNMDYYFAVRAYDEGDYFLGTPSKLTNRAIGLPNTVTATPLASRPGNEAAFEAEFDAENRGKAGGIYNLKLLVNDDQRFNQLFAGKTLELLFYRDWFGIDHDQQESTQPIGLYNMFMFLQDSSSGQLLGSWGSPLPPQLCAEGSNLAGYFTENTVTWVDTAGIFVDTNGFVYDTVYSAPGVVERIDTTTFLRPDNTEKVLRSGSWASNAVCLPNKYILGTVGLSFDYTIEQWGGEYRQVAQGSIVQGGDPSIYVGVGGISGQSATTFKPAPENHYPAKSYQLQPAYSLAPEYFEITNPGFTAPATAIFSQSYNNGPGVYEITFEEGGTETITTPFVMSDRVGDAAGKNPVVTFENVPYLNMRVRNIATYERPDLRADGTVGTATVSYDFDLTPQALPLFTEEAEQRAQLRDYPNPELVRIGSYTTAAYGWRNSRRSGIRSTELRFFSADSATGRPVGRNNRYYLSRNLSTTGQDTLDFVNVITIAGAQFTLDWSRFGRKNHVFSAVPSATPRIAAAQNEPSSYPTADFKAGDKVVVSTFGGALGYPFPRTKASFRVKQYDPEITGASFTDEQLDQVQVVPNPYLVTHEGMSSAYDGKIYFTRLPRKATISIYTTSGELINTFNHDESTSSDPGTFGTMVWDLLTRNRQRVASQMLIAKIETPDGASVMRKFTIVTGPARIVANE